MNPADKWNQKYTGIADDFVPQAAYVLREYAYLLPPDGRALDLACGMAGNAFFLADRGLRVFAWDYSAVAIERVNETAKLHQLPVVGEVRDVCLYPPLQQEFDVIVVSRFLDRELPNPLMAALRPGGLLFYQTFVCEKTGETGPSNPDYLLQKNELLAMFSGLTLRAYSESGQVGNCNLGPRNEAMLVGQLEC